MILPLLIFLAAALASAVGAFHVTERYLFLWVETKAFHGGALYAGGSRTEIPAGSGARLRVFLLRRESAVTVVCFEGDPERKVSHTDGYVIGRWPQYGSVELTDCRITALKIDMAP